MTGTRDDDRARTHVGEWADLVGDDVPERALRERTLRGTVAPIDEEETDWPGGAG